MHVILSNWVSVCMPNVWHFGRRAVPLHMLFFIYRPFFYCCWQVQFFSYWSGCPHLFENFESLALMRVRSYTSGFDCSNTVMTLASIKQWGPMWSATGRVYNRIGSCNLIKLLHKCVGLWQNTHFDAILEPNGSRKVKNDRYTNNVHAKHVSMLFNTWIHNHKHLHVHIWIVVRKTYLPFWGKYAHDLGCAHVHVAKMQPPKYIPLCSSCWLACSAQHSFLAASIAGLQTYSRLLGVSQCASFWVHMLLAVIFHFDRGKRGRLGEAVVGWPRHDNGWLAGLC